MRASFQRLALPIAVLALCSGAAQAQNIANAQLTGYEEVPALNSAGTGMLRARIKATSIDYELSYSGLATNVAQAHIHFGQKGVNGGISVFLCTNIGGGTPNTPPCPAGDATFTGTLTSADVLGPTGQNIAAGDFDALVRAMRAGVTYANVHTSQFPAGEMRGQIKVK